MMQQFWAVCLSRFEQELPAQQFHTWIKGLRIGQSDESGALALVAPNRFVLQWVRERYVSRIEALGLEYFSQPVSVRLSLPDVNAPAANGDQDDAVTEIVPPFAGSNGARARTAPLRADSDTTSVTPPAILRSTANAAQERNGSERYGERDRSRLNPSFTFDNLVTGRANELARAAAIQVAQNPGMSYNPIFIYGGVGLGKTHLVHALGNEVMRHNPDAVIRYVHADDYYADVVRAYQQKSFDTFKRYYRSLDVLLIDDIQFFNNKTRTQEEFFYAFNALTDGKKQIVITCDTYPKNIQGVEERLTTRFGWGLTVQIEPPELEMRVAILKKKAELERMKLGDDVAFLIAKNIRSNVRELEGALKKIIAFAHFHKVQISLEVAREALKDLLGAHNRQITLEFIQKTVADYFKIKVSEMYSKKRTRAIARPRQVAMWLAKELTPESYPAIGEAFGGRDHTTVLHACRTVADLRLKDEVLNHDLHVLVQTLRK
ncbi:MAG: chromosomal replication initiator protein DnaA [Methyloversatilis sp.]|jgi:chromosomal replication initiator protein|nr:chromosomal replication initiator protein DnaA [Methyloversatilis sp.]MBP6193428.1 chromosomal replication initiator protein DnaA [Methyloversatilis sp.]MBP9118071.1 chromosomal replication initiator protein DnaA [Methyloversatilis sp.]